MPNQGTLDSVQSKSSSQFNARLSRLTHTQVNNLSEIHGLTKTQVVIVAVDGLVRDLETGSVEADKDVRRLKTVARIASQIDLGQDS